MTLRLAYGSDLHLEMERAINRFRPHEAGADGHPNYGPDLRPLRDQPIDALILAGDIDSGCTGAKRPRAMQYASLCAQYLGVPALLVAGNHEFYQNTDMARWRKYADRYADEFEGATLLQNSAFSLSKGITGYRILGCTLWTDFAAGAAPRDLVMQFAVQRMQDYRAIRLKGRKLRATDVALEHAESRAWLAEKLRADRETTGEGGRTVVATHHAPTHLAINADRFGRSLDQAYYVSELDALMEGPAAPAAWICGHTHARKRMKIGNTTVAINCRGYLGEMTEPFAWEILEV